MKANGLRGGAFEFDEYPLEMLDKLVAISLHPKNVAGSKIRASEVDQIAKKVLEEEAKLELQIKSQVFQLVEQQAIKTLIRHYHSSLVKLMDRVLKYLRSTATGRKQVTRLYEVAIKSIERVLGFIEENYQNYLDEDERIPPTYLEVVRQDVAKKANELTKLKEREPSGSVAAQSLDVVLHRLHRFLKRAECEITFKGARYYEALINKLLNIEPQATSSDFAPFVEVLIYMNFNSKEFIRLLSEQILNELRAKQDKTEKMEALLYYQKAFNQLSVKPDTVFNPQFYDLNTVMNNWFDQEISYLREVSELKTEDSSQAVVPEEDVSQVAERGAAEKVTLNLSSDQIALIIRGADEARVVMAKSMNYLFKVVVPHLSTTKSSTLSFSALRSRSYNAEESDKMVAIAALQKIIDKIKRLQ